MNVPSGDASVDVDLPPQFGHLQHLHVLQPCQGGKCPNKSRAEDEEVENNLSSVEVEYLLEENRDATAKAHADKHSGLFL